MGEAFITRRGGGRPYAVIGAIYPAGSSCTCTNGTRTMTAKDTGGRALFIIPAPGTWTVTAASGSQDASREISVTAEGQVESVKLSYELMLFDSGAVSGYAWNASYNDTSYADSKVSDVIYMYGMTYDNGAILKTSSAKRGVSSAIDLSDYSRLKIRVKTVDSSAGSAKIQVGTSALGDDSAAAAIALTAGQTTGLDISGITGSGYISILAQSTGGTYGNIIKVEFDRIWLE